MTEIEWTHRPGTKGETWNPTRGCSLTSPGCTNCYAMRQAHRFSGKGKPYHGLTKLRKKLGPVWTGKVRLELEMLDTPLRWREARTVFVNSMSDLFHETLGNEEIAAIFGVMAACPQHTFQILTKRAARMRDWFEWVEAQAQHPLGIIIEAAAARMTVDRVVDVLTPWPLRNVWLGVSVEDQQYANLRVPDLLRTPSAVRFVSYEPALGSVDFTRINGVRDNEADHVFYTDALRGYTYDGPYSTDNGADSAEHAKLDWIIIGGESGPGARMFDVAWPAQVIAQCEDAKVACFVKQLGRHPNVVPFLKDRKGGDMSEWAEALRVRQYPEVSR